MQKALTVAKQYDIIFRMSDEKLLELKKFFEADKFVGLAGIDILETGDDYAVVGAEIGGEHLNAGGAVQGGMLYTAADFAFAVLTNMLHPVTVTQTAAITYIRAAYTSRITATAKEIVRSGHNCVVEVTVRDDAGNIVCTGSFNGFINSKK